MTQRSPRTSFHQRSSPSHLPGLLGAGARAPCDTHSLVLLATAAADVRAILRACPDLLSTEHMLAACRRQLTFPRNLPACAHAPPRDLHACYGLPEAVNVGKAPHLHPASRHLLRRGVKRPPQLHELNVFLSSQLTKFHDPLWMISPRQSRERALACRSPAPKFVLAPTQ